LSVERLVSTAFLDSEFEAQDGAQGTDVEHLVVDDENSGALVSLGARYRVEAVEPDRSVDTARCELRQDAAWPSELALGLINSLIFDKEWRDPRQAVFLRLLVFPVVHESISVERPFV